MPPPEAFYTALADRYAVGSEIGRGGMATVYTAEDLRHQRRVAIKVLDPELAAIVGGERFLAEIRVTAGLQHPNLLPLFDSGEAAGLLYYVMPLVNGPTLRARLERERQLPVDEAVRIVRAIANALDYAHRQGVVHRDLKPENILLQDGEPLVADFGIALAVTKAAGPRLTGTGISLGTPHYMSPEQAVVDSVIDRRSDIYSLACILYELLAGDPPFTGSTMQAIIARVVSEPPGHVRTVRPSVPVHVDDALARALAKVPADRFGTAREFADALVVATVPNAVEPTAQGSSRRRQATIAVGAALLTVAALGGYAVWRTTRGAAKPNTRVGAAPVDTRPSVGVIPVKPTTGDVKDEIFGDGLADELIGSLGKLAGLKVAARTSSFALKGKSLDVRAIGESLGVATVLEMSVRRAENRLKVTAQLASASDGGAIWSQSYDHAIEMRNVIAVQEDIARSIVQALRVQLGGKSGPLVRPGTSDTAAYGLYLQARSLMHTTPTTVTSDSTIAAFNGAIARDPSFAQAFAGLADTYLLRSIFRGRPPLEDLPHAKSAAEKALALDSTIAEAHVALASVLFGFDWDWLAAEREFDTAFALDPGYADGSFRYGIFLMDRGRLDEAERAFERARVLDPLVSAIQLNLGRVNLIAGRTDRAIELLRQVTQARIPSPFAFEQLGHAYLKQGNSDSALAAFRRAAVMTRALDSAHLAYALAKTGRQAEATAVLTDLLASSSRRYVPPVPIAVAYVGLDNADSAFQWLDKGFRDHAAFMDGLKTIVAFEAIHRDPRWERLLRRMGLADSASR